MDDQQQQINLPSLAVILLLSGLIIRYLFFSSPAGAGAGSGSSASSSSRAGGGRQGDAAMRAREAAVERIQQMFPQVDRRTVLWDLQRTGGSVAGTTERILAGRLETPPITFQPPPLPGGENNAAAAQAKPAPAPAHPDLITRYKLQDKLDSNSSAGSDSEGSGQASGKGSGKAWSTNRDERQSLLQRRRDQMILEARRKMEAKIAAEKAAGGS